MVKSDGRTVHKEQKTINKRAFREGFSVSHTVETGLSSLFRFEGKSADKSFVFKNSSSFLHRNGLSIKYGECPSIIDQS